MINLAFSINNYHFIMITPKFGRTRIGRVFSQLFLSIFHEFHDIRSPSLGACNYPIFLSRRFHETDRFLVWIYLEFRSPQELQWPIAVARFNRMTEGRLLAVTTCQLLELRNSVSLESFKNKYRNLFDVQIYVIL